MGSDIRSYNLAMNAAILAQLDHHTFYSSENLSNNLIELNDIKSKKYSLASDTHSDYIFNFPVDNISYINRDVYAPPLVLERNRFLINNSKWKNLVEKHS